jgi:glycerol-3-phosphate cytidylyltransferase
MKYCFDLDGTICATPTSRAYSDAVPYLKIVNRINELYSEGHTITIFTARGGTSKIDHHNLTTSQLSEWGVKYHYLVDKGKPDYDLFIDDKAISAKQWLRDEKIEIVGFVASAFDLLHAGHCLYLKEAKSVCDILVAGLHTDPSVDRPSKNLPIQSVLERKIQLLSTKYVDKVLIYDTESDLEGMLSIIKPDIRILGSDAKGTIITGQKYCKSIYYHYRDHGWSSSELRNRL